MLATYHIHINMIHEIQEELTQTVARSNLVKAAMQPVMGWEHSTINDRAYVGSYEVFGEGLNVGRQANTHERASLSDNSTFHTVK